MSQPMRPPMHQSMHGPGSERTHSRRVVLHVGLAKTGTTWLQSLLASHRDQLREAGVLYPFVGPGGMFRGAVDVRGSAAKFGLDPAEVTGVWQTLCDRALAFDGTTVISHEVLAGATPEQVRRALTPFTAPGAPELHVVVTARDLGRQVTAHWQEEVKLGDTRSFAEVEAAELRADTGRDAGPDAGGSRPHFWHAQDFADTLDRWAGARPAGHGHLVVCPAPGAAPDELWHRFAEACGIDANSVDVTATAPTNPSLGAPETALLRAVNAAVGDRLDAATRLRVVKRDYAEGELARTGSPRPDAPASLREVLEPVTEAWVGQIRAAGHRVHGDPVDLLPVLGGSAAPGPDVPPPPGSDPAAIADRLVASTRPAPAGVAPSGGRLLKRLRAARRGVQ